MLNVILQRLSRLPIVLLGVSFIVFIGLRLIPGDPALIVAGQEASIEQVERIREDLGLNRPVAVQYVVWVGGIVRGDFGQSLITRKPVFPLIADRFGATLQLTVASTVIAVVAGLAIGLIAASRPYSTLDNLLTASSLVGVSVPSFWLAIMLILVFAVHFGWFPAGGTGSLRHLVLPAISLSTFSLGIIARMTRASVLEVLNRDYIRTARAKGLRGSRIFLIHALRNALLPVMTVVGLQFGYLMAGAVITETVFTWPGLGRLIVLSLLSRDFTVVQGSVLVVASCFVAVNLTVDLLYPLVDPRIRANS